MPCRRLNILTNSRKYKRRSRNELQQLFVVIADSLPAMNSTNETDDFLLRRRQNFADIQRAIHASRRLHVRA